MALVARVKVLMLFYILFTSHDFRTGLHRNLLSWVTVTLE